MTKNKNVIFPRLLPHQDKYVYEFFTMNLQFRWRTPSICGIFPLFPCETEKMPYLMMMMMVFVFSFLVGRKNLVCQEHKKSADENSEHEENYMPKIEKL